jgi:hypothetical protein
MDQVHCERVVKEVVTPIVCRSVLVNYRYLWTIPHQSEQRLGYYNVFFKSRRFGSWLFSTPQMLSIHTKRSVSALYISAEVG